MLQLSNLSLVAVNLPLHTFDLLFVVINFVLVVLLQCIQLLPLLTPYSQMERKGGVKGSTVIKKEETDEERMVRERKRKSKDMKRTENLETWDGGLWWIIEMETYFARAIAPVLVMLSSLVSIQHFGNYGVMNIFNHVPEKSIFTFSSLTFSVEWHFLTYLFNYIFH